VPELNLDDVQGFILRGYKMLALRQIVVQVDDPPAARVLLGSLVGGDEVVVPQITRATTWTLAPSYCLNMGISFDGLKALGLPQESLDSFPEEFRLGAVGRADRVGDVGDMGPDAWIEAFNPEHASEADILLCLYGQSQEDVERETSKLRTAFAKEGAVKEVDARDGGMLPGFLAHFGYADGFAQPTIASAPPTGFLDPQPQAKLGAFLLGYPSQFDQFTYPVPTPNELGFNGSFMVYRILEQDCHGFEEFLDDAATQTGLDRELIAAKLCGRWRNGIPLALSPDTPTPNPPILQREINNFDYAQSATWNGFDDKKGVRCPIGSHIRRANPRGSRIAGNGNLRRIVRRGLPYGPVYDPANPNDGIERGLLGMFINVSLKDQFEFIMKDWINNGIFAPGLGASRDPVIGGTDQPSSKFSIPVEGGPTKTLTSFARFVKTRGSMYCFLPSITALKYLAKARS
jgi:deferrochelatase/peroxidase EfeB